MHDTLKAQLSQVRQIANYSRLRRLLHDPIKYVSAIGYRKFIYPKSKKEKLVQAKLFYGKTMHILLPASTDIYLTGGKSHDSEIRLALYLINQLQPGHHFLDIGAHYGFFTLLARELVGQDGQVQSFEPTRKSFELLQMNTASHSNVQIYNMAVSDTNTPITFFEFPPKYSEYNAVDVSQYKHEDWYADAPPVMVEVQATNIDKFTGETSFYPHIIKIDVEGAELKVINGGRQFFQKNTPQIIMEYLAPDRKNETHRQALLLLNELGYDAHFITDDGMLAPVLDVDQYLLDRHLESDNIVFRKN